MEESKYCNLGDVCNTISETYRANSSKVVLINTSDVLEGACLNHEKVENKDLKGQFKKVFHQNDILYSEIRPANKRFAFMEELKEYRLEEIGTIVGGATPSTKEQSYYDGNISWITPKDLSNYTDRFISRGKRMISQNGFDSCSCKMLPKGSILFSSRAPIGYIAIAENELCTNQGFKSIIPNNRIVDNMFLFYLLEYNKHAIEGMGSGTTFKEVSGDVMKKFKVRIPCLQKQKQIASVLSIIDEKIELNRRINDNLELQAQALYKSWFVDFEPFKDGKFVDSELGMIPEGWSIGDIGTYSKVRSGFAFKSSWWTQSGSKVIKIKNITSDYRLDMTECSFVSKDNTAKASEFRVEVGDLLIAMTGATIGKFCLITSSDNNTYVNQRVGKFFLGNEPLKRLPFLYCCLKQDSVINEIINKGQGSAQPNISGTDIESIKIVLPNDETIPIFNEHLYPMYKMIIKNQEEIELLSTMRDSILPKLMSGELKVNDLNN